ncbi:MAG: tRNA (N(6)-L-threonylcarbamoyladenosine(37)-C(2))-methylthiotransferase MtaB [Planctomycetota bacterium]|nr:tRNA (N(6)-L-threonylcarbamoyladenosine(37)-C(2))-methylthiotransferase MtaB [Planctomycetota bacterium]
MTFRIDTLGCKVNQYEGQVIRERFRAHGMNEAGPSEPAALVVVNVCSVTATAEAKARKVVRRAVRENPGARVFVTGCATDSLRAALRRIEGVEAVIPNARKLDIAHLLEMAQPQWSIECDHAGEVDKNEGGARSSARGRTYRPHPNPLPEGEGTASPLPLGAGSGVKDFCPPQILLRNPLACQSELVPASLLPSDKEILNQVQNDKTAVLLQNPPQTRDPHPSLENSLVVCTVSGFAGHSRAFVKVQDGCDARCSYCIVPDLRGKPVSKPFDVAVTEIRRLSADGCREIVVCGIHVGRYGLDLRPRKSLLDLLEAVRSLPGGARIRLSSIEVGEIDSALLDFLAAGETVCPHLHVPLQSGSDSVLKRMNRGYSSGEFVEKIGRVRSRLDRAAITTDVIVGFPGEGRGDFDLTLDVCSACGFGKIHVFPFSPRPGTPAAALRPCPAGDVRERLVELKGLERQLAAKYRRTLLGSEARVLVEHPGEAACDDNPPVTRRKIEAAGAAGPDLAGSRGVAGHPEAGAAPQADAERTSVGVRRPAVPSGLSERYVRVYFAGAPGCAGQLVALSLTKPFGNGLWGERTLQKKYTKFVDIGNFCS